MNENDSPDDTAMGLSVNEAVRRSSISRSKLYVELKEGRLKARKLGTRTIVLASDLSAWLTALPTVRP